MTRKRVETEAAPRRGNPREQSAEAFAASLGRAQMQIYMEDGKGRRNRKTGFD